MKELAGKIINLAAESVSQFHRRSGEPVDSVPESLLQMHAYEMLGAEVSAVPEISFSNVWRRSHPGQPMHEEIERLDNCCIDLAVLASGSLDAPVTGLVEFKRWTPSVDDQIRIER